MKKIFLIVMSFFILTQTINANRDRVRNVKYTGEYKITSKAKFTLHNDYCGTKKEKTVDLWKYLNYSNVTAKGFNPTCSYNGGELTCEIFTGTYKGGALSTKDTNLIPYFFAKGSDLIGPQVKGNINFTVTNVNLNIMVDYNGNSISNEFKSQVVSNTVNLGEFHYKDSDECRTKNNRGSDESAESIKTNKSGSERSAKDNRKSADSDESIESNDSSYEKVFEPITGDIGNIQITGKGKDGIAGLANLNKLEISDDLIRNGVCSELRGTVQCYANSSITFDIDGDYTSTTLFINNENNTNSAGSENIKSFGKNDKKEFKSKNFEKAWDGEKKQCYTIQAIGNKGSQETSSTPIEMKLCIVPNPDEIIGTIEKESEKSKADLKIYANNKDSYEYEVLFTDKFKNVIKNKKIETLTCSPESECLKDFYNKNGLVTKLNNNLGTDSQGKAKFEITSSVPNKYENGSIKNVKPGFIGTVKKWNTTNQDISGTVPVNIKAGGEKIFNEPISFKAGSLKVTGNNINVSKKQAYTIEFENNGKLTDFNGSIEGMNSSNNLVLNEGFELKDISDSNKGISDSKLKAGFTAIAIAKLNDKIKSAISLTMKNLKINYNFNGYNISYDIRDNIGLDTCKVDTTGLILNGKTLAKGKESHTSEVSTFSNLKKSDLKKTIDKNAKSLIRGLDPNNNKSYNGVLYYNKDVTYSDIEKHLNGVDSLIIKNGNLLIDKNIDKNIGIVVLTDNFKTEINKNNKGNIFVKNNVEKIESYLYADGGLISAKDLDGNGYTDEELAENKLDLKGSIVSSNTVGGGEYGETGYVLPGNKKTTDKNFADLAERYDLNYLRKRIIQCEDKLSEKDKKENYSFKVEYNPTIQTKTPKVFKN